MYQHSRKKRNLPKYRAYEIAVIYILAQLIYESHDKLKGVTDEPERSYNMRS